MKCRMKSNSRMFLTTGRVDQDPVIILLQSATFTISLFSLKPSFAHTDSAFVPLFTNALLLLLQLLAFFKTFFNYVAVSMAAKLN